MQFTIVKLKRTEKDAEAQKKLRSTKYNLLFEAMGKLSDGDYIVVASNVSINRVSDNMYRIKRGLEPHLERLPRRSFECATMPTAKEGETGYDIIVKRTV